ncbi:Hsp33 family molecular chaperone HslO, partial [Escherichia coli]|nr:Hsp33 family molecular chaperone HslO [Escherichia coli]
VVPERRAMAEADGLIHVDCAFCSKKFPVPVESADA